MIDPKEREAIIKAIVDGLSIKSYETVVREIIDAIPAANPIITNGDRIRNMSNEELATWIMSIDGDYMCPPLCPGCSTLGYNCWRAWCEWFYKEAEEEADE